MESGRLQILKDWVKELVEDCKDEELLDLVCKLLLSEV